MADQQPEGAGVQHPAPILSAPGTAGSNLVPLPGGGTDATPVTGRNGGEAGGSSLPEPQCQSAAAESQADAVVAPSPQQQVPSRARRPQAESRSSRYRGVQWDRNGARWRARLHTDKTRHIGYFDSEEEAAMAWDMAVLRYFGIEQGSVKLNFGAVSVAKYQQEPGAAAGGLRRSSSICSGGSAGGYRGVVQQGDGNFKAVLLQQRTHVTIGIFPTAEEAARAYDRATILANGWGALTNFPITDYQKDDGLLTGAQPLPPRVPSALQLTRSGSQLSFNPNAPSRVASVQNLQQLMSQQAASGLNLPAWAAAAALAAPSPFALQASPFATGTASPVPLGAPAAALEASLQHVERERKRQRGLDAAPVAMRAASGATSASAGASLDGQSGVRLQPDGSWQAALMVDLGQFASQEEAIRAYDRAALCALGFTGHTHAPLNEAITRSAALTGASSGSPHLAPAQAGAGKKYVGVANRGGAFLALLDIGGSPYELGPFASEEVAAKAYDRYSLMLHGLRASTNVPLWEVLANPQEVAAISEAVAAVSNQQHRTAVQQQQAQLALHQQQQQAAQQQEHQQQQQQLAMQQHQQQLALQQHLQEQQQLQQQQQQQLASSAPPQMASAAPAAAPAATPAQHATVALAPLLRHNAFATSSDLELLHVQLKQLEEQAVQVQAMSGQTGPALSGQQQPQNSQHTHPALSGEQPAQTAMQAAVNTMAQVQQVHELLGTQPAAMPTLTVPALTLPMLQLPEPSVAQQVARGGGPSHSLTSLASLPSSNLLTDLPAASRQHTLSHVTSATVPLSLLSGMPTMLHLGQPALPQSMQHQHQPSGLPAVSSAAHMNQLTQQAHHGQGSAGTPPPRLPGLLPTASTASDLNGWVPDSAKPPAAVLH